MNIGARTLSEYAMIRIVSSPLCGVMVSVLAIGTKIRGFKPGQCQWTCKGDKNP
jgi:hypothetical protein